MAFKSSLQGNMIATKRPDLSNVEWIEAQIAQGEHVALATEYAQATLAEPKVRPRYERRTKKQHKRTWMWQRPLTSKGRVCAQEVERGLHTATDLHVSRSMG